MTPYLTVAGVMTAIDWYAQAFGAVPGRILQMPDGVVAFAEMRIGDAFVMLCDESPAFQNQGPLAMGGRRNFWLISRREVVLFHCAYQEA